MKYIKFLLEEQFKIIKILKISLSNNNGDVGYLPYLRDYDKEYFNLKNGDELDENIIQGLKTIYSNVEYYLKEKILFYDQLDEILKIVEGGEVASIEFQFEPSIPISRISDYVGIKLKQHILKFKLRTRILNSQRKYEIGDTIIISNIPIDIFDASMKTIYTI